MKKKISLIAALLLALTGLSVLSAETVTMISREDFDFLENSWFESYQEGSYEEYQNNLEVISEAIIPDDAYQYMLAEALFYKYYVSRFIEMPENEQLEASLTTTIEYCASIENEYPVLRTVFELFRALQKTAPFKDVTPEIPVSSLSAERSVDVSMLPDASSGRLLMLRTLAEVEAMSQRLKIASEARGGEVQMKLKESAYMSVMEKPAMVYVIMHEPVYAELRTALEQSGPETSSEDLNNDEYEQVSYGSYADAFYKLESLIARCEGCATIQGIPLSSILSEEAWTAIMLYHTDPFAVLCLNETALDKLNAELEFIADKCVLYVERINSLPEKREGSL